MLAERPPRLLELLDRVRIVNEREGNLVEAFVPLSLIYTEDVAVDQPHVKELAESMREKAKEGIPTGQLSPVLLGQVPDLDQFPIIDGFHRVAALDETGEKEVFSTIKLNTDWDDILDLRILAAASHRSTRFARLIEWIENSWKRTSWSKKVNVSQAFVLRVSPKSTGSRMDLTPEEFEDIKSWVDKKCDQWHLSAWHIYANILRVAQTVDPELIQKARERRGGWALEALTPLHLKELSLTLPGRYELQNIVADVAIEKALNVAATRAVAEAVSKAGSEEEAQYIIKSLKDQGLLDFTKPKPEKRDYDELLENFFQAQVKIAQLTIRIALLKGGYKPTTEHPLRPNPNGNWISVKGSLPSTPSADRVPLILPKMFDLEPSTIATILSIPLDDIQGALRSLDNRKE